MTTIDLRNNETSSIDFITLINALKSLNNTEDRPLTKEPLVISVNFKSKDPYFNEICNAVEIFNQDPKSIKFEIYENSQKIVGSTKGIPLREASKNFFYQDDQSLLLAGNTDNIEDAKMIWSVLLNGDENSTVFLRHKECHLTCKFQHTQSSSGIQGLIAHLNSTNCHTLSFKEFSFDRWNIELWKEILAALREAPSITKLEFVECSFNSSHLAELSTLKHIDKLVLNGECITRESYKELTHFNHLKSLSILCGSWSDALLNIRNNHLEDLLLEDCDMNDEIIPKLLEMVKNLPDLKRLGLNGNPLNLLNYIIELCQSTQLTTLNLVGTEILEQDLLKLLRTLNAAKPNIVRSLTQEPLVINLDFIKNKMSLEHEILNEVEKINLHTKFLTFNIHNLSKLDTYSEPKVDIHADQGIDIINPNLISGFFKEEGDFVLVRAPSIAESKIKAILDAKDTVLFNEWLKDNFLIDETITDMQGLLTLIIAHIMKFSLSELNSFLQTKQGDSLSKSIMTELELHLLDEEPEQKKWPIFNQENGLQACPQHILETEEGYKTFKFYALRIKDWKKSNEICYKFLKPKPGTDELLKGTAQPSQRLAKEKTIEYPAAFLKEDFNTLRQAINNPEINAQAALTTLRNYPGPFLEKDSSEMLDLDKCGAFIRSFGLLESILQKKYEQSRGLDFKISVQDFRAAVRETFFELLFKDWLYRVAEEKPTTPNGNCLFETLQNGFKAVYPDFPDLDFRECAVNYMRENKEECINYIMFDKNDASLEEDKFRDQKYADYIENMGKDKTWGGEEEIRVITDFLKGIDQPVKIQVFDASLVDQFTWDGPHLNTPLTYSENGNAIYAYRFDRNHYVGLDWLPQERGPKAIRETSPENKKRPFSEIGN